VQSSIQPTVECYVFVLFCFAMILYHFSLFTGIEINGVKLKGFIFYVRFA